MSKTYYQTLGVAEDATEDEIKKAYRKLARELHPDHGGDQEKFKEVSEAYTVLSDTQKRQEYDMSLMGGMPGGGFSDMFGFGDLFGFNNFMRRSNPNAPRKGKDLKCEIELPLKYFILGGEHTFTLTYSDHCDKCNGTGAEKREACSSCRGTGHITSQSNRQGIAMMHTSPCPSCMGTGFRVVKKCDACHGGIVSKEKQTTISIPKGIRDG